jgi:hypothetical protein
VALRQKPVQRVSGWPRHDAASGRCDFSPCRRAVSWTCLPGMLGRRFGSIQRESRNRMGRRHMFAEKILSAMRKGFGGQIEPKALHR